MDIGQIKNMMEQRKRSTIDVMKEYAVLILLVKKGDELHFVFEKRANRVKQPGDVCFPGGKLEPGESVIECALRETKEEIGIERIEILGQYATQYELASIAMHGAVGVIEERELEHIQLNPQEVEGVFTVPLRFFLEEEPYIYEQDILQDTKDFPYEKFGICQDYAWRVGHKQIAFYNYQECGKNQLIWGLTASFVRYFVMELKEWLAI